MSSTHEKNESSGEKVQVSVSVSKPLKKRLERFANNNGISQIGAIRMILNQELPATDSD